jgi:hypothetical protein
MGSHALNLCMFIDIKKARFYLPGLTVKLEWEIVVFWHTETTELVSTLVKVLLSAKTLLLRGWCCKPIVLNRCVIIKVRRWTGWWWSKSANCFWCRFFNNVFGLIENLQFRWRSAK